LNAFVDIFFSFFIIIFVKKLIKLYSSYSYKINFKKMDSLTNDILSGKYKQVVILSGAGVSTNSGIPDYRSKSGIFAKLVESGDYPDVQRPADFFSRSFVTKHPDFFEHKLVKKFRQQMLDADPTASHKLAKWFHDLGILHRVYTQNVDGLYQKTGLPEDKVIEFHGNYTDGTIVLYGDAINSQCLYQVTEDLVEDDGTDLLIVMGSSLQVAPFCAIPNLVNKNCTRLLVDKTPENAFINPWTKQKVTLFEDMYRSGGGMQSWLKFGKRRVSLRPQWQDHKKYPLQYIFKEDCDEWSANLMKKTD
jgi:NAD-dependent SIR2 family protein deacetylase